jgi:hypothetical protein
MMMALGFLVACCFSLRMTLFVCFLSFFDGRVDGLMVCFDAHFSIELFFDILTSAACCDVARAVISR